MRQGFVLGQYGLLYALQKEDRIERLAILNTPLATNTKLRPELAAYKAPLAFMRPGNKPFDAAAYNSAGSAYMMEASDGAVYAKPYRESPAASAAIASTMEQLDWPKLLKKVDEGYRAWRRPSIVLFGNNDTMLKVRCAAAAAARD